ncbi:DsrE/DsrF/DrsH-like family protein [Bacillus marinisedimentorum]|uniref:DsrE/DsrF/DrsH-like family protein n=1 Tax=Bacillus marinisedimentorum TaxID=1821260 RepID=UPI001FDF656A|nr:DsrE/DsrF/DrsH-like family protein [Bacillus marinisedimentorum]
MTRSENCLRVFQKAVERADGSEVMIFFDLDGARCLDEKWLSARQEPVLQSYIEQAVAKGVRLFGCQLNVMGIDENRLITGAVSAGVATFLEYAYEAKAVFSY